MTRVYIVDLNGQIVEGVIHADIRFVIGQMSQLGGIYFGYQYRHIFVPASSIKRLETV